MVGDVQGPLFALATLVAMYAALLAVIHRLLRIPTSASTGMTYLEHAEEARRRLLRIGVTFVFWFIFFLSFRIDRTHVDGFLLVYPVADVYGNASSQLYRWMAEALVPPDVTLIISRPTEAVATLMVLGLFLAALMTLPTALSEAWGFLSPGLRAAERRVLLTAIPLGVALFAAGAAFAFAVVVPLLFEVLYAFAQPLDAALLLTTSSFVGTVATMLTVFGLAFETPLVMVALSSLGIVQPSTYLRRWRHVTVAIVIAAALVTDPTLVSQLIVSACLLALYWIGVGAAFLVARPAIATNDARASKSY